MPPSKQTPSSAQVRLIVLASAELADGFRLLGFETWPDATPEQVETLLSELLNSDERAFVLLEQSLASCSCPSLNKCRNECNRVLIAEIPPLNSPSEYQPAVEVLVRNTLGPTALDSN